jgi:hypothetical protein
VKAQIRKRKTKKSKNDDDDDEQMMIDTDRIEMELDVNNDLKDEEQNDDEEKTNRAFFDDQYNSPEHSSIYGGEGEFERYNGVQLSESGNISDEKFVAIIQRILQDNNLDIFSDNIEVKYHKTLPDDSDEFLKLFTDENEDERDMKNKSLFQRRILGLTSYFKSAQEQLLPRIVLDDDGEKYYIESVDMSDYQFEKYEKIRKDESERDTALKRMKKKLSKDEMFKISSTYRIYSRSCCNFAFPGEIKRPMPENEEEAEAEEMIVEEQDDDADVSEEKPEKVGRIEYKEIIKMALEQLKSKSSEYFLQ